MRVIEYKGQEYTVKQLAEMAGTTWKTMDMRLRRGWPVGLAIRKKQGRHQKSAIEYRGKTYTYDELAEKIGMKRVTLYSRIHYMNMSVEDAVNTPIGQGEKRPVQLSCPYPDCDKCPYEDCIK